MIASRPSFIRVDERFLHFLKGFFFKKCECFVLFFNFLTIKPQKEFVFHEENSKSCNNKNGLTFTTMWQIS
jgi:hypothetical protein